MSWTPEQLSKTIHNALSGTDYALDLNLFASATIDALVADYLSDTSLNLAHASIENAEGGQSFIVRGDASTGLIAKTLIEVKFFLVAGEVELIMTATTAPDWSLADSFPSIKGLLARQLTFHPKTPPVLHFWTNPAANEPLMTFTGDVDLHALSAGVADTLGHDTVTMTGEVVLAEGGSRIQKLSWSATLDGGVDLKIITLDSVTVSIGMYATFNPFKNVWGASPYFGLDIVYPFRAQGRDYRLDLSVEAFGLDGAMRFEAQLTERLSASAADMSVLADGENPGGYLPSGFELEDVAEFEGFFFDFDPTFTNKIVQLGVDFRSTRPWTLLHLEATDTDWTLESLQLALRLQDPFGRRVVGLQLSGELGLGEAGRLELSGRYPNFAVSGMLKENTVLKLDELFREVTGSTSELPSLELTHLFLAIENKDIIFEADMVSTWSLSYLDIEEITVELARTASQTQGAINGRFGIAGVDIYISSTYDTSEGWLFVGGTVAESSIPIGTLIDDIAERFGSVSLPDSLIDLTVTTLQASFHTKTKDVRFEMGLKFPLGSSEFDAVVTIDIRHQDADQYTKKFGGYIIINDLQFNFIFSKDNTTKTFLAAYNNLNRDSLQIETLVEPVSEDIALYIPETLEITLQDALFIYSKNKTKSNFLFGLYLNSQINLSDLPLVGSKFPPEQTVSVDDLQFLVASQTLNLEQADTLNNLIPENLSKLPLQTKNDRATSSTALNKGLNLSARLQLGNTSEILTLPISSGSQPTTEPTPTTESPSSITAVSPTTPTSVTDNTKWFPIKKTLGPLYFGRVGVQYKDATLWFLIDASISAAGLTLTLDGLSVGSPIKQFKPKFNLHGIGIDYESKGAVSIGGSFLRTTIDGKDEYSGTVIVKTEAFTLFAFGSYTTTEGHPSLFIYGVLDKPIGGPPFFFVTGLALGFAYNRSLILPTLDDIPNFPLVQAALSGAQANVNELIGIQQDLRPYIPPKVGQVVLMVGIKFTSFKLIESFVLLVATFGDRFALNILGISTLIAPPVPPGVNPNVLPPPLAQVRFAILARFVPSEGTLKVEGKILPDSYLFERNCHLSGGFAFYSWFKGKHQGDFVLTVGGYHPRFQIPAHYPRVDPLALNWRISNQLSIKGSMYFALTASAIMAGGSLEAVWHSGSIKAWFIAQADFIVSWKPYFYDARISLSLGASYTFKVFGWRKTITVQVGASLHIWGPKFSGIATIDLWIVSFTIRFGDRSKRQPQPIGWSEFKTSFLPARDKVCSIAVESGLLRKLETADREEIFVVNPQEFVLTATSVIPLKNAATGQISIKQQTESGVTPETTFGVAPMNVNSQRFSQSQCSISVVKTQAEGEEESQGNNFQCVPIVKNIPTGLWGESNSNNPNRARFIDNVLSGYKITPANPPTPGKTQAIPRKNLAYDTELVDNAYQWNSFATFAQSTETNEDTRARNIARSITSEAVKNTRSSLLQNLGLSDSEIDLEDFETDKGIEQAFIIAPELEAAML